MSDDKKGKLDMQALREDIRQLFVRLGIQEETASEQARIVVEDLQRRFGGKKCYVRAPDKALRNARLLAELETGAPIDELARKYGLAVKTVRNLRATGKPRRAQRADNGGFGSPEWNL